MTRIQKQTISPLAAVMAIMVTFILSLFLTAVFLVLFGIGPAIVLGELLIIVMPVGYMLYIGIDIRNYVGLEARPKHLLLGLVIGMLLFLFDLVISNVLVLIFGQSESVQESQRLIETTAGSPAGLFAVILALSLAGVCEEFAFRGFLQTAINSRYSFGIALIVSSVAFGLFHFDPQIVYTLSALLMGLMLGYVYHRWHSYVISAVAHSTINLIAIAIMLLVR